MNKLLFIILLTICFGQLTAQDVSFTASAPSTVNAGQQFRLTYTLNAKGSSFKAPNLSSFIVLGGPSTSTSSNISIVNGNYTQSVTYTYTYFLQAADVGTFTIEPASIVAEGQTIQSNSVTINVVQGSQQQQQQQQAASGQQQRGGANQEASATSADDLFVRILVDKNSVYQGEQVVATIKIYTRVNLVGFEEFKFPSYKGFWTEEINIPNQVSLVQENFNGRVYNVGVLKKTILFPQKGGEIIIEPFELKCVIQERAPQRQQRGFWDSFFNQYQNVSRTLISPSVKINVKPLPQPMPSGFSGAVGSFQVSSSATPLELKTNESINYSIKISGNGNLRLVDFPDVQFPVQFEKFDPKVSENINATVSGLSGNKTADYLLIPRTAGNYTIPASTFIYFDLQSKSYKTINIEPYNFKVERGSEDSTISYVSGFRKEDIRFLGSDVRFIKTGKTSIKPKNKSLLSNNAFVGLYPTVILLFAAIIVLRRRQIKRNADLLHVKNRRAGKEAKKRLKKAFKAMAASNKELFYEEIIKAIWGYSADKLKINYALLSKEIIINEINNKINDENIINLIDELITNCELERYAPLSQNLSLQEIYNKTADLINTLERKLK